MLAVCCLIVVCAPCVRVCVCDNNVQHWGLCVRGFNRGGGADNTVGGRYAAIGGGQLNTNLGNYSVIVGGTLNSIGADATYSSVAGSGNLATGSGCVVAGGRKNKCFSNYGTVLGGQLNKVCFCCEAVTAASYCFKNDHACQWSLHKRSCGYRVC